ncbi:MAG: Uma2 family endonuclease [Limnothrix sp. RL_2_0]|nr:Uma2 family endonuclease [Limnothrix sp. RL_2_0]
MATETLVKIISPEEYLAQEEQSTDRHEYINGEIRLMAGGTPKHSQLSGNLFFALKLALKKRPYLVFLADQRLWIPSQQIYTYPDVMVVSKPLAMQEGRKDTILNACLVAEVLSNSTKNYDRSEKFHYYRSIPEFKEYLLIEQDRIYVEHYVRVDAKKWSLTEYTEIEDVISLGSVDSEIALVDIYEDIDL